MKMMRDLITVSGTLRIEQYCQLITATYEKYKWWFNKTFLHHQPKNYHLLIQEETQSYHWGKEHWKLHPLEVYYLWPDGSLQHDSAFYFWWQQPIYILFLFHVQTMLGDYFKANHPLRKKLIYLIYLFDSCRGQYKNYKNFTDLRSHKYDFGISAEWVFFRKNYSKFFLWWHWWNS